MSFFSNFFNRAERAPLPTLEELLLERQTPADLPGLEAIAPEFEHLKAEDRIAWADAIANLHHHHQPLPPSWIDAQFELLPQLVPTWQAEREDRFYRPFIEGVSQRVLVCGEAMPRPWLAIWGVTEQDAMDRALDHLLEQSAGKPFRRLSSGIYQAPFEDGLAPSRLLLPELWCDLFPGQNTFVAVPDANTLLVSPQVLLPQLAEAIAKAGAANHPRLMGTIYQKIGPNLIPATLQDPHPMAQPQRELRQLDLLAAYTAQQEALDPSLGVPTPVGMVKTQQGRPLSYALWQEGKPALLAETDLVGFVKADGRALGLYARQTLPRIRELRGIPVEIWGPRRLRYEGFPTEDQLESLECFLTPEQMTSLFKPQGKASPANQPLPAPLQGPGPGVQAGA